MIRRGLAPMAYGGRARQDRGRHAVIFIFFLSRFCSLLPLACPVRSAVFPLWWSHSAKENGLDKKWLGQSAILVVISLPRSSSRLAGESSGQTEQQRWILFCN